MMLAVDETPIGRALDPRVRRSRNKILAAARDALAECGYEGMTIEGVAERAGVGKATIYRHWSSKAHLVLDVAGQLRKAEDVPTSGGAFEQLCQLYGSLARRLADPGWSRSVAGLMDAARRDPELEALFGELVAARRAPSRKVLHAAVDAGVLPGDTDVEAAIDLVAGPLFYRRFFVQHPLMPDEVVDLVQHVFDSPPRLRAAHG